MLNVELTTKELKFIKIMIEEEIKTNNTKIIKMRENSQNDYYWMLGALDDRNTMLYKVKEKLMKAKYIEEE